MVTVGYYLASAPQGSEIRPLFTFDEDDLDQRRATGEARSGRQLADLNLYFAFELQPGTTAGQVAGLVEKLNALPSVEVAYVPSPVQPATLGSTKAVSGTTPDFQPDQGYLAPAPDGIDALYAWTIAGGQGSGVKVIDVESGTNEIHEDLPLMFYNDPQQSTAQDHRDHGTAVHGIVSARRNGFGVTGIAYGAAFGFESWIGENQGGNVAMSLMQAAAQVGSGDILLIEIQIQGPVGACTTCSDGTCGRVAIEYEPANFDAISMITASGIVVIEAAGNGRQSLDDPVYNGFFDRSNDSGAIFVAASDPGLGTGAPACFTNYGSRIDVHGWGRNVVATGYGDLWGTEEGLPEGRRYTEEFAGTSSASAIVAGGAASVQGVAEANLQQTLSPVAMRTLLTDTGTPPAAHPHYIGPLPDLRAALDGLLTPNLPPEPEDDFLVTQQGQSLVFSTQEILANDTDPDGDALLPCGITAFIPTYPNTPNGQVAWIGFSPPHYVYRYTPSPGFIGRDPFAYCVEDDHGAQATATITMTVVDPIFSDDYESANLAAWAGQVTAGSGAISVTDKAAIVGNYGMQVDLTGQGDQAYVFDLSPNRETTYRASFYLAIGDLSMLTGSEHTIFAVRDDVAPQLAATLRLRFMAGAYQVAAVAARDNGTWAWTPWSTIDKETLLSLEWEAGQGPGLDNGELRLLVDDQLVATLGGLDNDQLRVDRALLGAIFGVDNGTTGALFFDQFESSRF